MVQSNARKLQLSRNNRDFVMQEPKVNGYKRNCFLYETVHSISLLLYNRLRQILFLKSILCTHYCLQDSLKRQFCILLLQINLNLEDNSAFTAVGISFFSDPQKIFVISSLYSPLLTFLQWSEHNKNFFTNNAVSLSFCRSLTFCPSLGN